MKLFDYLQAFVTVIVLGVWAFLVVTGKTITPEIYTLIGAVVGFFFRSATLEAEKRITNFIATRKQDERVD